MRKTKRGVRKLNKSRKIYGGQEVSLNIDLGWFSVKKSRLKQHLKYNGSPCNLEFKISKKNLYDKIKTDKKQEFKIRADIMLPIGHFSATFNIQKDEYKKNESFLEYFVDNSVDHTDESKDIIIWEPDKYYFSSKKNAFYQESFGKLFLFRPFPWAQLV